MSVVYKLFSITTHRYGLQKPERAMIEKKMYDCLLLPTEGEDPSASTTTKNKREIDTIMYRACIDALWKLPHREEKYLALDLALYYKDQIGWDNLQIYENLLRESQDIMWWDLVDPIAVNLIGAVALKKQKKMKSILRRWIKDEDNMWIRRTAILAQLKHKEHTDKTLLLDFCQQRMHEKEFFIRKAIGWALREYSKTNPECVMSFLKKHKSSLSGLSYREASKVLVKQGRM